MGVVVLVGSVFESLRTRNLESFVLIPTVETPSDEVALGVNINPGFPSIIRVRYLATDSRLATKLLELAGQQGIPSSASSIKQVFSSVSLPAFPEGSPTA
jgi:hypothetical protein